MFSLMSKWSTGRGSAQKDYFYYTIEDPHEMKIWSRKFWELSTVSEAEWTKGNNMHARKEGRPARQREKEATRQERRKISTRNGWIEDQPCRKEVRKWTSGVHLELGFLSHNVRVFTHFVV
jgi:hypothetical protein